MPHVPPKESLVSLVPEEVKILFEKYRGLDAYVRWFDRFVRNCNSFTSIGKEEGLSAERIRQIYKKYFAPYLPHKRGREREKACTLHRYTVAFMRAKNMLSDSPAIQAIVRAVKNNGLGFDIQSIPVRGTSQNSWIPSHTEILINGLRIRAYIKHSRSTPFSANISIRTSMFAREYDFFICCLQITGFPEIFYIIPAEILRATPLCINKYGAKTFVLPLLEEPLRKGWNRKVDWRQYRNAWHLLKNPETKGNASMTQTTQITS